MELRKNSDKLAYQQIKSGIKLSEIYKNSKMGYPRLKKIFKEYAKQENIQKGICFGHKNEPYYDCEDYTMAEYSYDNLSLIEKEFYESRSN